MSTSSKSSPLVFLFGPTGVGKTRWLTQGFPPGFEVVAVDSIQVYRGFDIGSAKPTEAEQAAVRHHLIDIRSPDQPFDVGDFVAEAHRAVADIRRRGLVPVLSGGTAFYFQNFLLGLPDTPVSDPATRAQAQADFDRLGEAAFRAQLASVDPVSAGRIQPGDGYRLTRAWEVWLKAGRPLSSFRRHGGVDPQDVFVAGLDRPRDELYRRIDARVDAMLADGLEAEVRGLVTAGWGAETPAMKGIGYAEWLPLLTEGKGTVTAVRDEIALHSRHYAKRQLTFFRSLPGVRWYHPDQPQTLVDELRAWSLTRLPGWW